MINVNYADLAWQYTKELLEIDSPSGFTAKAASWVKEAFEGLGFSVELTRKGGVLVDLGGENEDNGLMLAAHAMGVGSCWINRARQVFDSEEGKAILRELGIEGDYEGIGNCILGYVDGEVPPARPRKENWVYWAE